MKFLKKAFPALAVLWVAVSLIGCALSNSDSGSSSSTGSGNTDTTAPTVSSTIPVNAFSGMAINANITSTFSEKMNPATINGTTFTLKQGTTPVTGTVTYTGTVAVFNPASDLAANTTYTATITTGAKDLAGNALAAIKTWNFTTGITSDTTPPTVSSTIPANADIGVAVNGNIIITFSEGMDPATITATTFILKQGTTPITGTVSYTGIAAIFNPASELSVNTIYTATVTTGVKDLAGNAQAADKTWSFTTGAAPDTTAPTVISTIPVNASIGVSISRNIVAVFSEVMDPLTITTATFNIKQGAIIVPGTVTYSSNVATFQPLSDLAYSTTYTATITTGTKDHAGNALTVNKTWNFTTGSIPAAGPSPVNLGSAGNFVILAKSGISTTGTTSIVGDIGLSPAAASFITGFSLTAPPTTYSTSALITGKIYASDYDPPTPANMTAAISDMETAYVDAAGRSLPDHTELGAGNISGLTLAPGLYKWGTGLLIASDVTLFGGPNDVWIFQIAGDLTMSSGVRVILAGGALAKNIFWQTYGVADLNTTAHLEGIIIAKTLINLSTGATVNGRLLAQTAVTLDANAVTAPAQ